MNSISWTLNFAVFAMCFAGIFLYKYVGLNFSLSSVMVMLLLLLHSGAYIYYINVWGPESGYLEFVLKASEGMPIIETVNIAMSLLFIGVCVGIRIADCLFGGGSTKMKFAIENWRTKEILFDKKSQKKLYALMMLTIIFMLVPFAIAENQLTNVIAYFSDLSGESEKVYLRRQFGGSSSYIYNLLNSTFVSFLLFTALAAKFSGRWHVSWCGILGSFLMLVALSKLALLSKGPFAILLLQTVIVYLMTKSLKLHLWLIFKMMLIVSCIFAGMIYMVNLGNESVDLIFDILFYRSLMIPNEGIVEYFSAIPYAIDFTWGQQISWITKIFDSNPGPATYWLVAEVHRGNLDSTTTAMFLADAWAEFSWYGVALFPLIVGMCLRAIDIKLFLHGRPTIWKLGGLSLGHFGIYVAMNTSFLTALMTGGILFVIPFSIWLQYYKFRLR
jgi:hypothetical protein